VSLLSLIRSETLRNGRRTPRASGTLSPRTTSLKKRFVSIGFSTESKSISVGFRSARVEVEVRGSAAGAIPRNRQAGGRAVKAGPGGAARRGSLDGPVVMLSPATLELDRHQAVLVVSVVVGLSGPHHC
jgi:hypothetical protein